MELRKSKKAIMAFAGLMILIFHVWIAVFRYGTFIGNTERFLVNVGYVGVDIFFFLSAYTLEVVEMKDYWGFEKGRFIKLFPYFIIGLLCKQFLWFIPSLMVVYLLFPIIKKFRNKRAPFLFTLIYLLLWAVMICVVENTALSSLNMGIFLYRIPVIILVVPVVALKDKKFNRAVVGLVLTVAGLFLLYKFGYMRKLNWPFKECFYLSAIPFSIGFIYLMDVVFTKVNSKVLDWLGKLTLEFYLLQMIVGDKIVYFLLNATRNKLITDIGSVLGVIALSYVLNLVSKKLTKVN